MNEKTGDDKYPTGSTQVSVSNGGIMTSEELLEYVKTTPFSNWTWVINGDRIVCFDALGSVLGVVFEDGMSNDKYQCGYFGAMDPEMTLDDCRLGFYML